ncbi:MAG: 50S ribosomal protein L5 [Candidatus Aenigmarchaeota archaeon]|nr:50S ribosomal protein L5 [Candidatus Aenigmarchaeota archaeon]
MTVVISLKNKYDQQVVPAMKEQFGYTNSLAVSNLTKVVINTGLGQRGKEDNLLKTIINDFTKITGQKPIITKAKKSISGFKIREGMTLGLKTTLRRKKMYDFVDRLINIILPRTRDFRGLSPKMVDRSGNLTIGLKEQIVFPEIKPEQVTTKFGLEITLVNTAKNYSEGLALFQQLGLPFKKIIE